MPRRVRRIWVEFVIISFVMGCSTGTSCSQISLGTPVTLALFNIAKIFPSVYRHKGSMKQSSSTPDNWQVNRPLQTVVPRPCKEPEINMSSLTLTDVLVPSTKVTSMSLVLFLTSWTVQSNLSIIRGANIILSNMRRKSSGKLWMLIGWVEMEPP